MTFQLNKLLKTKIIFFCVIFIAVTQHAVLAQNLEKPYTFAQGATASSKQINTNFDLLYEAINPLLVRVDQPEITKTHTMSAGQPANADHVNTNFDQLYAAANYLLAGFHLTEITKPHHFTNGEQSNPDHVNQNFDILFNSVNEISIIINGIVERKVPDTGQTSCYNQAGTVITCPAPGNILAQDGSYNITPPSFTNNGDGTVSDNVTGLLWQQEDDGTERTWYEAVTYCSNNTASLPGYEWRLPTVQELSSIQNLGKYNPASNSVFNNVKSYTYWTSTNFLNDSNVASVWLVYFLNGFSITNSKDTSYYRYVRCVRGEDSYQKSYFFDNGDGTITDLSTGLIWQQAESAEMVWETALSYCENQSTLAGKSDWRLPSANELQSLVDYSESKPSVNQTFFPTAKSSNYWSSTTSADNSSTAWFVQFDYGYLRFTHKSVNTYVRCIRGGL